MRWLRFFIIRQSVGRNIYRSNRDGKKCRSLPAGRWESAKEGSGYEAYRNR